MLAGELYLAADPELTALRLRARRLLRSFNDAAPEDSARRRSVLEQLLAAVGPEVWIEPPFFCDYGAQLTLGARVYFNTQCVVLDCNRVVIGDDVSFGPGVHLYAATHPLDVAQRRQGPEQALPIAIGAGCWIGGGSIVLAGVSIGEGTTVGAGSVVTRALPAHVLAVGNPCRVKRSLR
jgi:maltose O-acetyltransferase